MYLLWKKSGSYITIWNCYLLQWSHKYCDVKPLEYGTQKLDLLLGVCNISKQFETYTVPIHYDKQIGQMNKFI
jgi:hypothetical protein